MTNNPTSLPVLHLRRGNHEATFHGSWYRGEQTHFIPSKAELAEPDAVDRFIMPGWSPPDPFITKTMMITAFGSCFARHISEYLGEMGYNISGNNLELLAAHIIRFGEGMVNSFAIRQQFEWALGERIFPDKLWFGPNKEIVSVDPDIRDQTLDIIKRTNVFIITLGLSEIWYDKVTGDAFWRAIPKDMFDPNRHGFRLSSVTENLDNLRAIYRCIRNLRSNASVIFTLSPIPLMATFRPVSCLTANSVSKAILRTAVDEFMRENHDGSYYFPSYEIVTEMFADSRMPDNRHIKSEAISFAMNTFTRYYCIA